MEASGFLIRGLYVGPQARRRVKPHVEQDVAAVARPPAPELALRELHRMCAQNGWSCSVHKTPRGYLVIVKRVKGPGVLGFGEHTDVAAAIEQARTMASARKPAEARRRARGVKPWRAGVAA
jgi:hypothetical protein